MNRKNFLIDIDEMVRYAKRQNLGDRRAIERAISHCVEYRQRKQFLATHWYAFVQLPEFGWTVGYPSADVGTHVRVLTLRGRYAEGVIQMFDGHPHFASKTHGKAWATHHKIIAWAPMDVPVSVIEGCINDDGTAWMAVANTVQLSMTAALQHKIRSKAMEK